MKGRKLAQTDRQNNASREPKGVSKRSGKYHGIGIFVQITASVEGNREIQTTNQADWRLLYFNDPFKNYFEANIESLILIFYSFYILLLQKYKFYNSTCLFKKRSEAVLILLYKIVMDFCSSCSYCKEPDSPAVHQRYIIISWIRRIQH